MKDTAHFFLVVILVCASVDCLEITESHGSGSQPCLLMCVGSTDRGTLTDHGDDWEHNPTPGDTTNWQNVQDGYSYDNSNFADRFIKITIDTSKCNFIDKPVIITSLDANFSPEDHTVPATALMQGASAVTKVTKNSFTVYMLGWLLGRTDVEVAIDHVRPVCGINWRATGYVC